MHAAESCLAPGKLLDKHAVLQNTQKEGERKSLLGAEQNYYKQLFLESSGNPGDLRISEVSIREQKHVHWQQFQSCMLPLPFACSQLSVASAGDLW